MGTARIFEERPVGIQSLVLSARTLTWPSHDRRGRRSRKSGVSSTAAAHAALDDSHHRKAGRERIAQGFAKRYIVVVPLTSLPTTSIGAPFGL